MFFFLKTYPTKRNLRLHYPELTSVSHVMKRVKERLAYLAGVMTDVAEAWDERTDPSNQLPHLFPGCVTYCLDTFPVYIQRPRDSKLQRLVYNGKFKRCCVKVRFFFVVLLHSLLSVLSSFASSVYL